MGGRGVAAKPEIEKGATSQACETLVRLSDVTYHVQRDRGKPTPTFESRL